MDIDIDSFASSAQFVNWPREFVIAPNQDSVVIIFQFVRESVRLCIHYIANGTDQYKRVRIVDDVDSFRNDYGYPKYFFARVIEHNREIDNYDNRLLAVFQYYTGNSIRPIFMYDVIINKLNLDEIPDDWTYIYTDNLLYFDLNLFDFSDMHMPNYPVISDSTVSLLSW